MSADRTFDASAAATGGTRRVRWATRPGCALDVAVVTLSPAGDDSLTNTINELKAQGFTRADRKYLVWMDAAKYCGIAEVKNDDRADASNAHNFGPMFGRVDSACWGRSASTEAHELMHMLGGVQHSAPHATAGWHCTDESDRMCGSDGPEPIADVCGSSAEMLFDCGNDDYFSTSPSPGSYLATHWNAANNVFLASAPPDTCSSSGTTFVKKRRRKRGSGRVRSYPLAPAPAACG